MHTYIICIYFTNIVYTTNSVAHHAAMSTKLFSPFYVISKQWKFMKLFSKITLDMVHNVCIKYYGKERGRKTKK